MREESGVEPSRRAVRRRGTPKVRRAHLAVQIAGLTALIMGVLPLLSTQAQAGPVSTENACTNALSAAPSQIPMVLEATAPASGAPGTPVNMSGLQVTGNIPASFIQAGIGLGVLHDGEAVSGSISVVIHATNATVVDTTLSGNANATIHAPGGVAQPLTVAVPLGDHAWTPVAAGSLTLAQGLTGTAGNGGNAGAIVNGSLLLAAALPGLGTVNIACKPGTVTGTTATFATSVAPFVTLPVTVDTTTTTGGSTTSSEATTSTTDGSTTTTSEGSTTTTSEGSTTTTSEGTTTTTSAGTTTTTAPVAVPGKLYGSCKATDVVADEPQDALITASVVKGVQNSTYTFVIPSTTTGTMGSNGTANYHTVLAYDFQAANEEQLKNTVIPQITTAASSTIAATAWLQQALTNFKVDIPLPSGATIIGTPTVVGTGAGSGVTAAAAGGTVSVNLPSVKVGNYQTPLPANTLAPVAPFTVGLDFTVALPNSTPPALAANAASFGLDYTIGINLLGTAHQGGATSTQTCTITSAAPPVVPATTPATVLGTTQTNATLPRTGPPQSMLMLVGLALVLIDLGYLFVTATRPAGRLHGLMRGGKG